MSKIEKGDYVRFDLKTAKPADIYNAEKHATQYGNLLFKVESVGPLTELVKLYGGENTYPAYTLIKVVSSKVTVKDEVIDIIPKASYEYSEKEKETDGTIRPDYYGGKDNPYEVFKVLRAWGLDKNFFLGNVIKYVARVGKKNAATKIEELEKALTYLTNEIQHLKDEQIRASQKS